MAKGKCPKCGGESIDVTKPRGTSYCKPCQVRAADAYKKKVGRKYGLAQHERFKLRAKTRRLVTKGVIPRQPCVICGEKKVEIHHNSYESAADIVFFCRKHHLEHHKK